MGPVKFTANPLRVSKNTSGPENEIRCSIDFHKKGLPLLVSSQLLRSRNLGQIDLARLVKDKEGWVLEMGEVKSSEVGGEQMLRSQRSRLFSAQRFLAGLFGHRTKLILLGTKGE